MKEGFSEIMTLEETARYLKIGKSTLYKMARKGKIPAVKIANQWRFIKEDIDKWLQEMRDGKSLTIKTKESQK
ncbi:MAG: helix-turn-helix domain-containing protein [Candidatus Desulfofervidus auxilii]|nr:helix-turn-helix domain-containing protein [Candidatus Desulfofervidus auxilii]